MAIAHAGGCRVCGDEGHWARECPRVHMCAPVAAAEGSAATSATAGATAAPARKREGGAAGADTTLRTIEPCVRLVRSSGSPLADPHCREAVPRSHPCPAICVQRVTGGRIARACGVSKSFEFSL